LLFPESTSLADLSVDLSFAMDEDGFMYHQLF